MVSGSQSGKLRIGVIGTSPFTQRFHLDSLKGHPAAQVTAICGRNRQRAEDVAQRYGIPHVFTDYRELVAHPDVNAVVVVTPNDTHHPMALATIEAGKHLFCEKPLGMDLAEAKEMYEKAEAAGIVHMTNFTNRGTPAAMRMKELLDEGYVGQPYHISVMVLAPLYREDVMPWRRDKPQTGTGVLGDIGSHMIDLSRWFMGDVRKVAAHMSTVSPKLRLPDTGEVVPNETDDTCAMVLEYENGVQGMIHVSWVAHPAACGIMRAEVHGREGVLLLNRRRGVGDTMSWVTVQGAKAEDAQMEYLPPNPEVTDGLDLSSEDALVATLNQKPYYAARRFVEAVLGNREAVPSLYDGMVAQAVIDAVVESDRKGVWVDVPRARP